MSERAPVHARRVPGRPAMSRAAAAVAATSLLVAAPAHGQALGVALGACKGVSKALEARCGSVSVPVDRADPGLGTTSIGFAVVPRRDAGRPSLGTLVGPGGPGTSLIDKATQVVATFAPLMDRRDLVLVDPRGTGRSDPIACRSLADVALGFTPHAQMSAAIGACGRELGPRAGAYGNAAVADDLDAVRAALGIERLDLFGASYGTYLMTVYAGRHPEHVRSVVLDAGYPIAYDAWGLDKLAAARRGVRLICARTRACSGSAVLADVARLATRLRRHPVSFTARAGDRRFRLRMDENALAIAVYGSGDPRSLARLPAMVRSALDGDLTPLRRSVETWRLGAAGALADPSAGGSSGESAFLASACHDFPRAFSYADSDPARRAAYESALAALDAGALAPFSPAAWVHGGFESPDWCLNWPADPTAGSPLASGTSLPDVPVLVLSGDLDTNVPSSQGRSAAALYPRATFVEIPNAGHTPTDASPCAAALAAHFIRALSADPNTCAGTGAPPPVTGRTPVRVADLAPVVGGGGGAQRQTLALIAATIADVLEQASVFQQWGSASGLRGGRYVARPDGGARLVGVRVVRDARASGALSPTPTGVAGTLRVSGAGVLAGQVRVRLTSAGRGRATGTLGDRSVDLTFRTS
jgi:pimeloyl-ACP methyl ester carboxylesterase